MDDKELIRNFLDLLDQSGFPDERKKYWLERIGGAGADPGDERLFTQELQAHLKTLDDAVELTEAQISSDEAGIKEGDAKTLPYLRRLEEAQPGFYEKEMARYRKEVLAAEKQMMTDVEGVRGEAQAAEIDAIRKKLLS